MNNQLKNTSNDKEKNTVEGALKGETQKAVLIVFPSGQEVWFPKSTIHSDFKPNQNINQRFLIDSWILKKNNIVA